MVSRLSRDGLRHALSCRHTGWSGHVLLPIPRLITIAATEAPTNAPTRRRRSRRIARSQALGWRPTKMTCGVTNAVQRVQTLYANAGPHVEAFRLNGLPQERTKAAWPRLRKAQVDPRKVLAVCLAIELTVRADHQPDSKPEFRRVQMAKQVHKMASGTHKRWPNAAGGPKELHVYPGSRGQALRHLGANLEGALNSLSPTIFRKSEARSCTERKIELVNVLLPTATPGPEPPAPRGRPR